MLGFTVEIDLSDFFTDIRKHSFIYIDLHKCKIINDVENHIKDLFTINEDICLVKTTFLSDDICLYPTTENVRLLNSLDSTLKIKVLRARGSLFHSDKEVENDEFQPETAFENVDTLLPVITVKDENYDYNEDFEKQDKNEFNSLPFQGADNGYSVFKNKENIGLTKVLCNTGVQTEDTSSESLSLIDLNDDDFIDTNQTESRHCDKGNTQDGSNPRKRNSLQKKKSKICVSSVIDLDQECDSDCKIMDTNRNAVNILNQRCPENKNEKQNPDFKNRKVKCKKKKKKKDISDDEMTNNECVINFPCLANPNNEEVTFHLSDMQNSKKRRKTLSKSHLEMGHEFCANDSTQTDSSHCSSKKQINSSKVLHIPSAMNCDDIVVESFEEKNNINVKDFQGAEVKESLNNNLANIKKSKKRKNYDIGIESNSPSQKCDTDNKTFEQLIENQQNKSDCASFVNVCKELPLKKIELNQEKSITSELSDESQLYLSSNNAIQNGSSYTEYEQNSVTDTPTSFSDFPLHHKRKRIRKRNKKAKLKKLADAAKTFAEENIIKLRQIPFANYPRNNSHKFFSDNNLDEGIQLSETSEFHICNTQENSDIRSYADHFVKSDAEESIKNGEQNSFEVTQQFNTVETNKSSQNVGHELLMQQELKTLLKKVKKEKKVLVFEYKNSINRNLPEVVSDCHDTSVLAESEPPPSKENLKPQTVSDFESSRPKEEDKLHVSSKKQTNEKSCANSCETIDVSNYPIISNPIEGDVIMFKILHLGSNYEPEISNQIIGKILSINCNESSQKTLSLEILRGGKEFESPSGKFSMNEEEKTESQEFVELQWNELIEPRLFYP